MSEHEITALQVRVDNDFLRIMDLERRIEVLWDALGIANNTQQRIVLDSRKYRYLLDNDDCVYVTVPTSYGEDVLAGDMLDDFLRKLVDSYDTNNPE